ncbi:TetR/AcrR family transcriptional regulator [Nonomuraea wenchangensis]|uniref:TetR/AcrR family transcriptional regulator n=1 Tax=Nonomuraea wenchangensis TaxID=568860 RepID=UPI00370F7FCC
MRRTRSARPTGRASGSPASPPAPGVRSRSRKLEEIAEQAGLTTGVVYSLFGSKNGLLIALVTDYLTPAYGGIEQTVPDGMGLVEAVEVFARHYRRLCDDPDALRHLSFEISLQDLALRDPELAPRLAASVRAHEERLTALLSGRVHDGSAVTSRQARRLAAALRALMVGLSQGVTFGLADAATGDYFAAIARALITPDVLGPP